MGRAVVLPALGWVLDSKTNQRTDMRDLTQLKNDLVYWTTCREFLPAMIHRSKSAKVRENREKDIFIADNQIRRIKADIEKLNRHELRTDKLD